MRYKNTKTGAVVDSASIVKGENWELVEDQRSEPVEEQKNESDENTDLKKLTKVQLSKMLDEKGIEYKPEQTKEELINLLLEE